MDAIVFDWDGTLCDSLPAIYDANRSSSRSRPAVRRRPLPRGLRPGLAAHVPAPRASRMTALEDAGRAMARAVPRGRGGAASSRACRESLERLVRGGLRPGPRDRRRPRRGQGQLERFGIAHLLPVRVFGTTTSPSKPHPDPLLRGPRRARPRGAHRDGPVRRRRARTTCGWPGRWAPSGSGSSRRSGSRDDARGRREREVYPLVADFVDDLLRPERRGQRCRLTAARRRSSSPTGRSPSARRWTRRGPAGTRASTLVVAADGGARHAAPLGLRVDRWVGDGDSIDGRGARGPRGCGHVESAARRPTRTNPTPSCAARGGDRGGRRRDHRCSARSAACAWTTRSPTSAC